MKSIGVFLLVLVLLEGILCCEGCWKEERDALLVLKSHINGDMISLNSWEDDTDCCLWERVECNSTTRRVAELHLFYLSDDGSSPTTPWHLNFSDFIVFKDLKTLDLHQNKILGCVETHQGLENLEVLDLSANNFHNATSMLSCLDGLSSLKSLSLSQSLSRSFNSGDVFETLSSKLLHLEVLDISYNTLTKDILPSLKGFTSLNELYLSGTGLDSDIHIQDLCAVLKNLEVLDISGNNFTDTDIASALSGLLSLKSLNLGSSEITPRSIDNISKLRFLEILDLSGNHLNESFLWTLENDGSAWPTSLQVLGLSSNSFGNNILSHVTRIPGLKSLDLSDNQLNGSLDVSDFRELSNLEELVLDRNYDLGNEFFRGIGELTSLKVLSLSDCKINGTLLGKDWSKLKKLEELDLSFNEFAGPLPSSFINMTSLRTLKLGSNYFIGNIGLNLASLTSLEYLSFEDNQFEFPISFTPFVNNSNLKFINGNDNKVILESPSTLENWVPKFQIQDLQLSSTTDFKSIPLPNFLLYQYNLSNLDFSGCKLEGEFPNWLLENNTNMKTIVLNNCSFTGEFTLPTHPLVNMERIDISQNAIKGQLLLKNISSIFPSLQTLYMSGNALHGSIPYELSQMNSLLGFDLSDNQLSGEIPYNISQAGQQLNFLSLSNNKLHGSMPSIWSNDELNDLVLDGNFLSGSIPIGFYNSSNNIHRVDLRNNLFIGEISRHVKNLSSLWTLDLSNNYFKGSIPSELGELQYLEYLDLSQNHLTGCVPSFVKSSSVGFIHLAHNNLSGLSKNKFSTNSSTILLDLSYNEIINGFQDLMQDLSYSKLRILLMSGNHFTGNIPKQLCQLKYLNILDLSANNFFGEIPNCLGKMHFDGESDLSESVLPNKRGYYVWDIQEKAKFTSKRRSETYTESILAYMSGIDLSCNKLNGIIPSTLGNLTRVKALNLSHNYLTGKIPSTFSNLSQVESLDLSFNMLSGQIPPQLCELTFIEVFSVAYNNLSGATPERKEQFSTFDESSYEGNQFLCGPPLPKSCNANGQAPATLPNVSNEDGDHEDWMDMYVFRVSFGVAYTSILLVIAAVLYINPYWRQAWFYYIELVGMNCYYFIEDHLFKFFLY